MVLRQPVQRVPGGGVVRPSPRDARQAATIVCAFSSVTGREELVIRPACFSPPADQARSLAVTPFHSISPPSSHPDEEGWLSAPVRVVDVFIRRCGAV